MDLALGLGVLVLQQQSSQTGVGLDLGGGLVIQVGRTPGQLVEALHLSLFTGEVLGQLVQGSLLGGVVALGLHAHELAAVEGAQVVLLAVHLEGGQIGDAHVVAQDVLDGLEGPGAGDDDGSAVGELVSGGRGQVLGRVDQLLHALDGDEAVFGIEVVVDGDELAVIVGGPVGLAAGGEEPGGQVPGRGLGLEGEELVRLFAVGDQLLQGVHVFLGDNALVIVHEVAVIGGHGVGIQGLAGSGGSHNAGVVGGGDGLSGLHAQGVQGTGLHQTGELVLRKAVQIGAGVHVHQHLVSGSGLGHGVHVSLEDDAVGVVGVEVRDLLLGQVNSGFADPNGDLVSTGQRAGTGSGSLGGRSLGSGSFGGGSVGLALGSGGSGTAAGSQGEDHRQREKQGKKFLHFISSSFFHGFHQ